MSAGTDYIICENCDYRFDRSSEYKYCSNCFACTGCEIYYCPSCDYEIIVKPVKKMRDSSSENNAENKV